MLFLFGYNNAADSRQEAAWREAYSVAYKQAKISGYALGYQKGKGMGAAAGRREGVYYAILAARQAAADRRAIVSRGKPMSAHGLQPGSPSLAGRGEVLVVGDSLEVLSAPFIDNFLPRGTKIESNVVGGYSSLQIYELFQESYRPAHSVIVFDAGTNDNPNYPEILQGRLQAVAEVVGPQRCLVVPTIYGYTVGGVDSSGKNAVVREFVRSRPNTFSPDWAAWRARNMDLMMDELHPDPEEGARGRARLIARGIRACLNLL